MFAVTSAACAELLDFGAFMPVPTVADGSGGGAGGEGGGDGGVGGKPIVAPVTRLLLSFEGGVTEVNVAAEDGVISLAGSYDGSLKFPERTLGPSMGSDAFAAELDLDGEVEWVESETVAGTQRGRVPFVNSNGTSYVAGTHSDGVAMFDELTTPPARSLPQGYVFDLGGDGMAIDIVGTASNMTARVLAAAAVQNIGGVIAGDFVGTMSFAPPFAPAPTGNDTNAFVARVFEPAGSSVSWVTDISGTEPQALSGAVFDGGYVYAVGSNFGLPYLGSKSEMTHGGEDMLVAALDADGNGQWIRSIGGVGTDSAADVAVDATGSDTTSRVWVIGSFTSSFNVDNNPVNALSKDGLEDVVLLRLEHDLQRDTGTVVRAFTFGEVLSQKGLHVEVDGAGYVWIGGVFRGTIDFGDGGHVNNDTDDDCFIARFPPEDTVANWSTTFGGDGPCVLGGMATFRNPITEQYEMALTGTYQGGLEIGGTALPVSDDQASIFFAVLTLPP